MSGRHDPPPLVSLSALVVTLVIVAAIAWGIERGHISGDAGVGVYSAIIGYVLGHAGARVTQGLRDGHDEHDEAHWIYPRRRRSDTER